MTTVKHFAKTLIHPGGEITTDRPRTDRQPATANCQTKTETPMIQTFDYDKEHRFFVAQKLDRSRRYRSDFKHMHPTREEAEQEAVRLTAKHRRKFYVGEIQAVTNYKPGTARTEVTTDERQTAQM